MKTLVRLISTILIVCSFPLMAQEPVIGVDNPEALFRDDDPVLHRNKQAAFHIMKELLQCNQWDRAGEWLTDAYHQHNPQAASGLAGVVYFFTQVAKRPVDEVCDEFTQEIVAVIAEDDYVTVMWPRKYVRPDNANEIYYTTWFDTWRFVDGKADEHWDPANLSPGPTPAP